MREQHRLHFFNFSTFLLKTRAIQLTDPPAVSIANSSWLRNYSKPYQNPESSFLHPFVSLFYHSVDVDVEQPRRQSTTLPQAVVHSEAITHESSHPKTCAFYLCPLLIPTKTFSLTHWISNKSNKASLSNLPKAFSRSVIGGKTTLFLPLHLLI